MTQTERMFEPNSRWTRQLNAILFRPAMAMRTAAPPPNCKPVKMLDMNTSEKQREKQTKKQNNEKKRKKRKKKRKQRK